MEQTSQTTATTRNVRVKAARLDFDSCGIPTSDDWTKYETTSVWFTDRPITCKATPGTPILLGSFRIFLFSVAAFVAVGASLVIEFELTSRVEHWCQRLQCLACGSPGSRLASTSTLGFVFFSVVVLGHDHLHLWHARQRAV